MLTSGAARLPFLTLSLYAALGCAGSQTNVRGAEHANVAAAPAQAVSPVPSEPLALVVGAPSLVLDARIDRLRESAVFASSRPLVERALCKSSAELDAMLGTTQRAVAAVRTVADQVEWLSVLQGNYAEPDVDRMLAAATRRAQNPGQAAPTTASVGRFTISTEAEVAVSVLDQRTALLGTPAWVRAAIDSIDHPTANFSSAAIRRELGEHLACSERTLCVLAVADSFAAKRLQHTLSGAGAKALGRLLIGADTGLGVNMTDSLVVAALAQLPTPDAAANALQLVKDWLWQAGLVIRLAGLPDVLDSARVQATANLLQLDLGVQPDALAQLNQRLGGMLDDSSDGCAASAATAAQ